MKIRVTGIRYEQLRCRKRTGLTTRTGLKMWDEIYREQRTGHRSVPYNLRSIQGHATRETYPTEGWQSLVECTGLENRHTFTRIVGSNPTPSAEKKNPAGGSVSGFSVGRRKLVFVSTAAIKRADGLWFYARNTPGCGRAQRGKIPFSPLPLPDIPVSIPKRFNRNVSGAHRFGSSQSYASFSFVSASYGSVAPGEYPRYGPDMTVCLRLIGFSHQRFSARKAQSRQHEHKIFHD